MATTARIIGIATTAPITVDPIIIDPIIMAIIDRTIITAPTIVRITIVIIGKHDYRCCRSFAQKCAPRGEFQKLGVNAKTAPRYGVAPRSAVSRLPMPVERTTHLSVLIARCIQPVVTYGISGLHYDHNLIDRKSRRVRRGLLKLRQAAPKITLGRKPREGKQ
jgi:hypothetical protein